MWSLVTSRSETDGGGAIPRRPRMPCLRGDREAERGGERRTRQAKRGKMTRIPKNIADKARAQADGLLTKKMITRANQVTRKIIVAFDN